MNPIVEKQAAMDKIIKKYALLPKSIEVSNKNKELVFTFEHLGHAQCDHYSVQKELRTIFDFSKSVSVVIPEAEAQPVVSREAILKKAAASEAPAVPKAAEAEEKSSPSLIAQRMSKVMETNSQIITFQGNPTPAEPAPQKQGWTGGGRGRGRGGLGKKVSKPVEGLDTIDFSDTLSTDRERHCYQGRIFGFTNRELRQGKQLIEFNITDEHGSISCKIFAGKDAEELLERLKDGLWVKVEGVVEYDEYVHELVLMPKAIEEAERPKRTDDAEIKRVELHMHSQYSAMDAVSKVKKIVGQAKDFGHDIISITDHGVVQAYPEIMKMTKGTDIKVLYGVEGYLINDDVHITFGDQEENLDGEFVFFDLETTGLVSGRDAIIEIAAVKIKNRHILDTFSTFVNPHRKVPQKITELTGITNQMVEDGEEEEKAVRDFLAFADGQILVAHNATFDMGFMGCAMEKYGIPNAITFIDTLTMSRALIPTIARHNLKKLASYFKIDMGHHHRALDDSICSAKVFIKLIDLAVKRDCYCASSLNGLIDEKQVIRTERPYHVIIFAKNQDGLRDLYEIVSIAHIDYFYKKPRIPKSLLAGRRKNLLIGSACEAGELYTAIKEHWNETRLQELADFYDYYEIQPLGNNEYMVRNGDLSEEDLIENNKKIVELGRKENKLVVATGDVHFVDPGDAYFREILQAGQGYRDSANQPPLYYHSTAEMLSEFDYLDPETAYEVVVTNTRKVADMIDTVKPVPDGTFPPIIEGSDEEIRGMVYKRAREIYGDDLPDIVEDRIKRELDSIIGHGYSVLYLIAQKLVHHSLEDGYLVGSRGSVGSSLVAMLCGITEVNSLPPHYICPQCKHVEFFDSTKVGVGPDLPDANCPECGHPLNKDGFDIPFETFLGFKGDKEPDIDLNFSGENQGEAHRYTEVLFGKGKVYRAGTIATLADKTAFGYVKNFLEEKGKCVSRAETQRIIEGCAGITRTTGQHPGGVMVVPKNKDIYEFTPIQYPANDPDCGTITTHFDYHSIEGRLLKLDILGHDDPTMLRMLKDLTGVDPQSIPLDDENVLSLFRGTEALKMVDNDFDIPIGTCGVPEFGTTFVRDMVTDAKPTMFADLVRISGLSHGTNVWINNAQTLIETNTASIKEVICTRDDIMLGLIAMGLDSERSFKIMEHVRKGRGLLDDEEPYMREHNVPEWYIDSCKKISYMFPKAHAVAYVMMAFRIAYYKVYYPLAYYATYFSIRAKEFDLETMVAGKHAIKQKMEEIKAQGKNASNKDSQLIVSLELALEMYCRGFEFTGVDIYQSHYHDFRIVDGKLVPPLISIEGLGEVVAKSIYEEAQVKPFMSMEDLQRRAHVNKSNLEKLEKIGCLGSMPASNQMSFI